MEENILKQELWANTFEQYLIAFGLFLGGCLVLFILEKIILRRLRKLVKQTQWTFDDIVINVVDKTLLPLLYLASFFIASKQLTLNESIEKLIGSFCIIVLTIQVVRFIASVIVGIMHVASRKKDGVEMEASVSRGLVTIVNIVVWGLGVVFVLDNLGFNISTLVAGLGIGGVAIAFAAQAILGDLFNYFVIFFDKPFERGDFIIVGDFMGVIENIGIKTTRIRSLGGEQIVFSNTDLTSSRVRNYKRMQRRRILFKVGVVYQTTKEQMQKIPPIIKEIINNVEDTVFDRAHFQKFGDFSMDIEIVYYVLTGDYNKYMDIQEKINLGIMGAFAKEGIAFAYPTQTLFVNKENQ